MVWCVQFLFLSEKPLFQIILTVILRDCACVSMDAASPQRTKIFQAVILNSDANARRCWRNVCI
jgi:hypothetical protein